MALTGNINESYDKVKTEGKYFAVEVELLVESVYWWFLDLERFSSFVVVAVKFVISKAIEELEGAMVEIDPVVVAVNNWSVKLSSGKREVRGSM